MNRLTELKFARWASKTRMNEGQVERVLYELGLSVSSEHDTHYMVYCPFHFNNTSPAATVAKETGYFWCFNGACAQRMKMIDLVRKLTRCDEMHAMRFVEKQRGEERPLTERLKEIAAKEKDLPVFDQEALEYFQEMFWEHERPQEYFAFRGLNEYSAKYFGMGYDPDRDMIMTPMYSTDKKCVGVIGRSIAGKEFKNSVDLPTFKTLFNIQNAKRAGEDTLILVESNFDAIRIHQAGFKNVCATLGGSFSDYHMTQIYRSFNRVILMTDDDEPGKKFGQKIAKKCRRAGIGCYRGKYDEYNLFPNGAKDVNDMRDGVLLVDDQDILRCIKNADIVV